MKYKGVFPLGGTWFPGKLFKEAIPYWTLWQNPESFPYRWKRT